MINGSNSSLSIIAWGHPLHPRTFSGCSLSLVNALETSRVSVRCFSAKNLRLTDALRGAFELRPGRRLPSLQLSRSWMWSHRGNKVLERRLNTLLRKTPNNGPYLQIGTLVDVPKSLGPHYVLTDMTIRQAHQAGHFAVSKLRPEILQEAVEIQGRVLTNAEHVFVFSDWARAAILQEFDLPENRVTTVYAGANLDFMDLDSSAPRRTEILFVGIDWVRNGGPLLLEAFERVRQQIPHASLRIVGCSPKVSQPGVFVEGFLDRKIPADFERLKECYLSASCFCLPSLFDPFPTAILEASAAGLPSVAIDNGSRREAINDHVTGRLVHAPEPEQLADALIDLLSDDRRASTMGAAARDFCQKRFTWQSVAAKIKSVIFKSDDPLSNELNREPLMERVVA